MEDVDFERHAKVVANANVCWFQHITGVTPIQMCSGTKLWLSMNQYSVVQMYFRWYLKVGYSNSQVYGDWPPFGTSFKWTLEQPGRSPLAGFWTKLGVWRPHHELPQSLTCWYDNITFHFDALVNDSLYFSMWSVHMKPLETDESAGAPCC